MTKDQTLQMAKRLCEKFINKVNSGQARSVETYNECKLLLKAINRPLSLSSYAL